MENIGTDWMTATYRFVGLLSKTTPPLEAWGVLGNDMALVWARVEGRTWQRVCAEKKPPGFAPPTVLGLHGLPAGHWRAEIWDTYRGEPMTARSIVVGNSGRVRVPLPTVGKDLAVKVG